MLVHILEVEEKRTGTLPSCDEAALKENRLKAFNKQKEEVN